MALQQLNTVLVWPGMNTGIFGSAPITATRSTLDAAGEYDALIYPAREAMTISHVGFRTGSCTGSPTADVRIETVATDGTPSGTLWATNTNIVTATLVTSTFAIHSLTAAASITPGQVFAIKIAYNSGTSFVISGSSGWGLGIATNLPYSVINVGSPTKDRLTQAAPLMAVGNSSTTFYNLKGLTPATTFTANSFNNTSSARRGLRFQVPFKCRCVGIRFYNGTSVGDFNAIMFDDAGTELSSSSTAYDGDHTALLVSAAPEFYFDNPVTLSPGTWYRAVLEPTSSTNITLHTATLPTANYRSAYPSGSNAHYTTYVASSWTDSATDQLPLLDILIDQLDDGVSTGGGAHVIGG